MRRIRRREKPMKPLRMNPPIDPIKMTNMGTGEPMPIRIGRRILSETVLGIIQTASKTAVSVSVAENI